MAGELVVVFEGGPRVCKELVVSVTFTLSFCSSFLLFGLWGWVFLLSEGSHVVEGDAVGSDGRVENVQWGTMFCVKGGLEVFGENVCSVVGRGYSPDSHSAFHVILLDFVVTDVN